MKNEKIPLNDINVSKMTPYEYLKQNGDLNIKKKFPIKKDIKYIVDAFLLFFFYIGVLMLFPIFLATYFFFNMRDAKKIIKKAKENVIKYK